MLARIVADLGKEAAALVGQVVEIYAALGLSALGQVGAVGKHVVELRDGGK